MFSGRLIGIGLLCGVLAGCWAPREASYSTAAVERPQSVEFFYGRVIDVRAPVKIESYGCLAAPRDYGPRGAAIINIPFGVLCQELLTPNLPAYEYTVLLDVGRESPYSYLQPQPRPAVLVVQNHNLNDPADLPLGPRERVFVRVVGTTGRLFAANRLPPEVEPLVAAPAPMPVPLGYAGQINKYPGPGMPSRYW
jgi:hypothetical protein